MRTARRILAAFFVSILLAPLLVQAIPSAYAGTLQTTLVRLNRMKENSAAGGMVCIKTPSTENGTEANVSIAFPSDFTLNSTVSNYTVTTSSILTGATSWPGIDTATSVSGTTVTFPSNNLSANTLYCFNFSGTNTVTTGDAGAGIGSVTTKTSGAATIDSNVYGVTIRSNDQVTVTASIAANPTDFDADLTLDTGGNNFPQDTELDFTLTYGSNLSSSQPMDVVASWSRGAIAGSGTPTVDVLEYVSGSAGNAYASTPPIIDTVNRTITWSIDSFPATTPGQTVTFSLLTTDEYTGSSTVSFDVSAHVESTGTSTTNSTVTKNYLYNSTAIAPTPTNTPGPTNTSTPGPQGTATPTPTPTLDPTPITIQSVDVREIGRDSARILVRTSKPVSLAINYGTSVKALSERLVSPSLATAHVITLTDLSEDTQYYFQVIARDITGKTITSDIYTLTTALPGEKPVVRANSLIVVSRNIILHHGQDPTETRSFPFISLPRKAVFQFSFTLEQPELLKNARVFLRNKNILGLTAYASHEPNADTTDIVEIRPGTFVGTLSPNIEPATYSLIARIGDYNGNITEDVLADVKILNPFLIVEKDSNIPVENARVLLSLYNPKLKLYEEISSVVLAVQNPSYSQPDGEVPVVLSEGRYQAEISAIGYKDIKANFAIGPGKNEIYPLVRLEKEPFGVTTTLVSYTETFMDTLALTRAYLLNLSESSRLFDFLAGFALLTFFVLVLYAFSAKSGVPIHSLPHYLAHHTLHVLSRRNETSQLSGNLIDEKKKPVSHAAIFLLDGKSKRVLSHTVSTPEGSFRFQKLHQGQFMLSVLKDGFEPVELRIADPDALKHQIVLAENPTFLHTALHGINKDIRSVLGAVFEFLLVMAILLQILHSFTYSFVKTLPFMALSLLNIWFWLIHIRDEAVKWK